MYYLILSVIAVMIIITLLWRSDLFNKLAERLAKPNEQSAKRLCKATQEALGDLDDKIEANEKLKEKLEKERVSILEFKEGVSISTETTEEEEERVDNSGKEEIVLFDTKSDKKKKTIKE